MPNGATKDTSIKERKADQGGGLRVRYGKVRLLGRRPQAGCQLITNEGEK